MRSALRAGAAQHRHDGPPLNGAAPPRLALVASVALSACSLAGGGGGAPLTPPTPCSGDLSACLAGTAATSSFTGVPARMVAKLYREFPLTGASPLATVEVASDGTWTFSGLAAWDHYFVQAAADFGQSVAPAGVAGPLVVPTSAGGAPVAVTVKPVELTVAQQALSGGAMQLASAFAVVFDPGTGAPVSGASVAIGAGGAQVALQQVTQSGVPAYSTAFPSGTATQPTYTITVDPRTGGKPSTWQLVGGSASFAAALTSPKDGATVPQGQPLAVSWPLQPAADLELVELFAQQQGAWVSTYVSPQPSAADATTETIPGAQLTAGQPLLLNVVFGAATCAAGSDGCVLSDEIAAALLTAM